jgi:hypothetical protein
LEYDWTVRCFKCEKEIEDLKSFLALDKPYVNLPFHRECYISLDDEMKYVTENYDRIIEYVAFINTAKYKLERKKK